MLTFPIFFWNDFDPPIEQIDGRDLFYGLTGPAPIEERWGLASDLPSHLAEKRTREDSNLKPSDP